jgi:hypothetical protein
MEISFTTKEESKKAQEEAFLALSPSERVQSFFKLMQAMSKFPTKAPKEDNGNFVIEIKMKKNGRLGQTD